MEIDREQLRDVLRTKGFNEIWIEEIDEAVRIKQLFDEFKREKGLPNREAWKVYDN